MRLKLIDFHDIFDPDKVITSSEYLVNKKKFNDEGIFSEKIFGANADNTPTDIIGWIDFGDTYIINPIMYDRVKKVFTNKILNQIINYNKRTNEKGEIIDVEIKGKPIDDQFIGLIEFRKRFPELLEKYGKKDIKEYLTVKKVYEEGKLFTNIFPVFSSKLRPAMLIPGTATNKDVTLKYDDINKIYNFIIEYSNKINAIVGDDDDDDVKLRKLNLLYSLQMYSNNVVTSIIDTFLKGKKGIFRKLVASTRVNFSSRNVITPFPDAEMDKVYMPYKTFLELYRFLLINIIVKTEKISYNKANEYFCKCRHRFDKKMYRYMNELLNKSKDGLKILLNRNPTINIGSILVLNIGGIKEDFNDLTLSLSNSVLSGFNADFDGKNIAVNKPF